MSPQLVQLLAQLEARDLADVRLSAVSVEDMQDVLRGWLFLIAVVEGRDLYREVRYVGFEEIDRLLVVRLQALDGKYAVAVTLPTPTKPPRKTAPLPLPLAA